VLYPSVFNGSYPYTSQTSRAALITSEVIFLCNTNYLDRAFSNKTYAYLFAVAPAFHGDDVAFTYYDGGAVSSVPTQITNATVAFALQDFITSFALEGKPVAEGVVEFPQYGDEAQILVITDTEMGIFPWAPDDASNPRCLWWQEFLTTELK
jgi:carboxylesterase type B